MNKRPYYGTPWKEKPKTRRNGNQKKKTQEKNYVPKNIGKISDETSEDGLDWEDITENFTGTDLGECGDLEDLTSTAEEEEFSSPEIMRREAADCAISELPDVLQRYEPEKCDDCGRDLVIMDDDDENENQELEVEKSWSLIGNTSDGEENELDVSFGDGILHSTERESRKDYHFTCFLEPTNLTCSKDDPHISETQGASSTVIQQPEKSKEQLDVILGDAIIRSTNRESRMNPNFTHSLDPTNSKCGKDFTHIAKTQRAPSTVIKQSEKSKEQLGVSDGNGVLHHSIERESRNKPEDVNFTRSDGSTTLKIEEKCSHMSATQSPSAPTMKLPEKSEKQEKKDSNNKSFHSRGKDSKRKNYSITFNAPVNISLCNYENDCNCVSKSLNYRGSKISKDLSKHILEFFDKKKNNSSRESCANTCNDLKQESGPHESCATACNYPNHESGIHESFTHACNNLNHESGVHESSANGCNYLNHESGIHASSAHASNNLNHESGIHASSAHASNNLNHESGVYESSANACNNLNKESESHERTSEAAVVSEKNSISKSKKKTSNSNKRSFQKRKKHSTTPFVSKAQGSSPVPDTDVYSIVSDSSREAGLTFKEFRKSLKLGNKKHSSTRKSSEETVPTSRIFDKSNLSSLNCERSGYATPTEPERCLAKPREEFYFQDQESFGNYMNTNHLVDKQQQTEFNPSPTGCRVSTRRRKLFEISEEVDSKVSKPRKEASSKKQKAKSTERKKTVAERCDEYEEFLKTVPIDDLCYRSPNDE